MTVDQAVKKYKLQPVNEYTAKVKAQELSVEQVLYMNVSKNSYAYVVKDSHGLMLYRDERNIFNKLYKGIKMIPLEP